MPFFSFAVAISYTSPSTTFFFHISKENFRWTSIKSFHDDTPVLLVTVEFLMRHLIDVLLNVIFEYEKVSKRRVLLITAVTIGFQSLLSSDWLFLLKQKWQQSHQRFFYRRLGWTWMTNFFLLQEHRVLFALYVGASNPVQHRQTAKELDLIAMSYTFYLRTCKILLCLWRISWEKIQR